MIKDLMVIEDNPGDALLVKEYLAATEIIKFNFVFFDTLARLEKSENIFKPAVILLDLSLPDSSGINTFERVYSKYNDVPIIILSGYDDEEIAYEAVKKGAQDYLIKGNINPKILQLAVIYAIERIKLVQSLSSSEQKFKLLTENAPLFIWMTDVFGKFVYCNKFLSGFLSLSLNDLCNKSMSDFIAAESHSSVANVYSQSYTYKLAYSIEYNLTTGFSIFEKAVPYDDVNGEFAGFICTGLDLSEIKRIEKEKNLNQEKYEFLAENSLDVIWKLDTNLNTIYCNKAIYAFLGYTPLEFMQLKIEDFLTEEAVLNVKKIVTKELYKYDETKDTDVAKITHLELEFINKNGELKYGEVNARLTYDFNTENLVIMGVTRDKTEKQKAEEKIKSYQQKVEILSNTAISFLEHENSGNIFKLIGDNLRLLIPNCYILVNSVKGNISNLEYVAGLGNQIKKLDKILGNTVIGRKTKLTQIALKRLGIGRLIKVDGGLAEVTLSTIPGNLIYILEKAFDVKSVYVSGMKKDDNLLGSVIIIMKTGYEPSDVDIIDAFVNQATIALNRKIAEESLIQSEQRLRDSVAAKDKFFSIISHDLRSPFQGILGYMDIITDNFNEVPSDDLQKILINLKGLIHNQYNLLENLLEWANIQRGTRTIDLTKVKLKDLVDQILVTLSLIAEKKEITIFKDISDTFVINADTEMLTYIINNLITNSIKFTNKGGVISIYTVEKRGNKKLIIEDNGIGMNEEEITNLFKIDKQKSKLGTLKEKGTGLGLILCKEFIDMHGWKLIVESSIGIGTKFVISIEEKIY